MKEFDLNRLNTARIYITRMAEGKNPANNQQVENEILDNPNVIRCLHFIKEILEEVSANHGIVGKQYQQKKEDFPVEVLEEYQYRRDKSVSYVLKQMAEPLEGRNVRSLNAGKVNKWLGEQGYLEKRPAEENGKECWFPTPSGEAEGLYAEIHGEPGREYATIMYTEAGQKFLVSCVKRMLTEEAENRERSFD